MNNRYIGGRGPLGAKLLIVGESPSYDEMESGIPFTGPAGRELDKLLRDTSINRNECWITNVVKYFVNPNIGEKKIPFRTRCEESGINIHQQIDELRNEINSIQPNCILALGGTALWALTGKNKIQDYRGSILYGMGCKVVATYHPAHLIHQEKGEIQNYWQRQIMIFDFKRALAQSKFIELTRPSRLLQICTNSEQLYDFQKRYKNYNRPSVDIEAHDCIPICIGISYAPHEGITVPLWSHINGINDSDIISIWRLLAEILYQDVIGQNFGYDRDKIKRIGFIVRSLISDTMLKAFVINPELPKNLAFNTSIYTEEPFYKNEGMYEGKIEDLLEGCARDACVTKEIDLAMDKDIDELELREFYEKFIMKLSPLYSWIENIGFRTDEVRRAELLAKYIQWDEKVNLELYKIAEGRSINTASPKQVAVFLYESLRIPQRKGTGEEVLTQLLNNVKLSTVQARAIELVLEDRRVKKTIGNYLLSPPDFDGRTRTSYFICLDTGRSATTQQEPPIRPYVKYLKKEKALGMAFQTITKHGDIGQDIRSMFIPDEGEIFLSIDSSQAEARVVAKLADDEETLEIYDKHDAHALTASWFFGGNESDYSKKVLGYESPYRFAGKTLRHAGNLGAGRRRAAIELNTQARKYKINFTISERQAEVALKVFHRNTPKIQQVFHKEVIECLQKTRTLVAPVPYGVDAPFGGKRTFFERWGDELFRQAFAYLPQRTVSENTKGAALRIHIKAPWIKIIVEAHDSLLMSVPIERLNEAILISKEEFEQPISFEKCSLKRSTLIIPCEVETGYNYQDLSKFK